MKYKALLLTAAMAFSATANAVETCPALDYQEMKDMEETELVKEYCQNFYRSDALIGSSLDKFLSERGDAGPDRATEAASQCRNQSKRIERVLAQRGTTVTYESVCKK